MKKIFIIVLFFLSFVFVKADYYTVDFNKNLLSNENYIYEYSGITINSTVIDNKVNISYTINDDNNFYRWKRK